MVSRGTGSEEVATGRGRMRTAWTIALMVLSALGVCASPASAEPLSMAFTEGRANVGADQLTDDPLFGPPNAAPFAAQIDGSGSIASGSLTVPRFSTFIEDPVDADVAVDFEIGVISGDFDQATGALTLSGTAGGRLTANGKECIVSTAPATLTLTTTGSSGGTSPRSGVPFADGLSGPGAIAGQWADMHAIPVTSADTTVCTTVEEHIEGPGGIWLEQASDVAPPAAPQLTNTDPASPGSSGTPRIRGTAEAKSTVRVYAGASCAGTPVATGSAAELGSPGLSVKVEEGVTAAFSATATDAAGNGSACSASISYTHVKAPTPVCVVPELVGKKLKAAKRAIRAAGCKVGRVHKPNRLKGKRRRTLVVKSSNPVAGAMLDAGGKVNLRLGPRPRKVA